MSDLQLYTYFRSSAAYRVRIALNLKKLDYESIPVHLLRDGGEHKKPDYLAKNPLGLVPALGTEHGVLPQSLAIIEYLDEVYPDTPLLPSAPAERARVRAIAQTIACEMHPLLNLAVLQFLTDEIDVTEDNKMVWYRRWIARGFTAIEQMLADDKTGSFCHGDSPTLADCCLVPQVFNAERFKCPLDDYPTVQRIVAQCNSLAEFQRAAPANQGDAE